MNLHTNSVIFNTDGYKLEHIKQYPDNTEYVYSNWTPRGSRIEGITEVVFVGLQRFILKHFTAGFADFFATPREVVEKEYREFLNSYLGFSNVGTAHILALHDLGYLPLQIRALPEGTHVPLRVPMFTIENTHPDFGWLTNYVETPISAEMWMPCTSATTACRIRKMMNEYAIKTTGSCAGVEFHGHDFSMRGMAGVEAAKLSALGHSVAFTGSDVVPFLVELPRYYPYDPEVSGPLGGTVPATEHSVMCAGGEESELETFQRLLNLYPSGIVSIVSDTWDFWGVLTNLLPVLKDQIMARDGKLVIRPDSGIPEDIICGISHNYPVVATPSDLSDFMIDAADGDTFMFEDQAYQVKNKTDYIDDYSFDTFAQVDLGSICELHAQNLVRAVQVDTSSPVWKGAIQLLWELFGGRTNELGYKVLDSHIGLIYGDAMHYDRIELINKRLMEKGFATTNFVAGLGSYGYQYQTRDTFGFAMKATNVVINGVEKGIVKDPKTDTGLKKSLKGRIAVIEREGTLVALDDSSAEKRDKYIGTEMDLLQTVWKNGVFTKPLIGYAQVRKNAGF